MFHSFFIISYAGLPGHSAASSGLLRMRPYSALLTPADSNEAISLKNNTADCNNG